MVTPRKLNPAQPGRKCASKMLLDVPDISEPPRHFDKLHRQMWDVVVNYPTFEPTDASYAQLVEALEAHVVYCDISDEIEALHRNGKKPERRLELARDAARRPFARILKNLVIG
jgi:hypothetical protein